MKYAFIDGHRVEFRVTTMCRVLRVARSGFYAWRRRASCVSQRRRQQCDGQVAAAFVAHQARHGAPRLVWDLAEAGYHYNRKTVAASLKRQGLRARAARKFKVTTDSAHGRPVAPNLLRQDFTATAPNQKWVGDITYLATGEGWLYLAVILDLYSRAVIGWAMAERMQASLVCDALRMALWRRHFPAGVIVHSDRGSQYASHVYQVLLADHHLVCSMSGTGCCYDNAVAESFFHSLKVEAIYGEAFPTRDTMRQTVFEYIEVDYNRTRRHSTLGYLSPWAFEAQRVA